MDQDRATLARDQANLANAQADLRRYLPLQKRGIVSTQQTDTQRATVAQLQATAQADGAALARDQVQLGYTTVRAPISGTLGLHLVDVGNLVNPADPAGLVALTQIQATTALVALPKSDLNEIQARRAETGGSGLSAQAWTQDGARQLDTGTLSALSNEIDPTSGTVTLKAVLPNAARTLWPGAAITVRLVLDTQHNSLTVPETAIDQGLNGAFVWTVGQDCTATATPVTLRQQLRGQALVNRGLRAGQQVVLDGQYGLTDHAHVEIMNPHGQQQARPTPLRTNQLGELWIRP